MFDIGWGELVVIGIIALIVIGPKELPTVMRTLGHWMGKVRRMASEFQGQFQEALREAEMADLKKQAEDLKSTVADATNFDPLADIDNDGDSAFETAVPREAEPQATAASAQASEASPPAASEPAEALPAIDAAPPAPPAPVTNEDFAAVEPTPKQAGGKA